MQSSQYPDDYSEEFHRMKASQHRTRDFDDWLRNVQRKRRSEKWEKRKRDESEDEEFRNFQKFKYEQEKQWPSKDSPEYIAFEKSFLSVMAYFDFASFVFRNLFRIGAVFAGFAVIGIGYEISQDMNLDRKQEVRPEYLESVKKKTGTLDDL